MARPSSHSPSLAPIPSPAAPALFVPRSAAHAARLVAEASEQARRLVRAWRSTDPALAAEARARVSAVLHDAGAPIPALRLGAARRIVAAEWGYPTWNALERAFAPGTPAAGVLVSPATRALLVVAGLPRAAQAPVTLGAARALLATLRGSLRVPGAPADSSGAEADPTGTTTRVRRELEALIAGAGEDCPVSALLTGVDAPLDVAVRLGAVSFGVTQPAVARADVERCRGQFQDGWTDDDLRRALPRLSAWIGTPIVCVWDVIDCWGAGGHSDLFSAHGDLAAPALGPIPDGLWDFLVEPDGGDADPATFRHARLAPYSAAERAAHDLTGSPTSEDGVNYAWTIDRTRELR